MPPKAVGACSAPYSGVWQENGRPVGIGSTGAPESPAIATDSTDADATFLRLAGPKCPPRPPEMQQPPPPKWRGLSEDVGSGGRIRTYDLWVMSPVSYQLLHPAM